LNTSLTRRQVQGSKHPLRKCPHKKGMQHACLGLFSFLTLITVFKLFDSSKLYMSKSLWDNFSFWLGNPPLAFHLHKQGRNCRSIAYFISLWTVSDDHMYVSVFTKISPTNQRLISYTSQGMNAPHCACRCVIRLLISLNALLNTSH
jgi:hypothetical protein